jgi:hypothetical protein
MYFKHLLYKASHILYKGPLNNCKKNSQIVNILDSSTEVEDDGANAHDSESSPSSAEDSLAHVSCNGNNPGCVATFDTRVDIQTQTCDMLLFTPTSTATCT